MTPREEDPQISVPMADIIVQMPGASAAEVENLVTINLEKRLWEMEGVEHIYSVSRPGMAMVTVRFRVGYDSIKSLVQIYNKLESNRDAVPPGVTGWIVKPVGINDVPILDLTLWSKTESDAALRRVADEILHRMQEVPDTGRSFGGRRATAPDPRAARRRAAGRPRPRAAGDRARAARRRRQSARWGALPATIASTSSTAGRSSTARQRGGQRGASAVRDGHPVYLRDVAQVIDGPAEASYLHPIGFGPAREHLFKRTGPIEDAIVGARGSSIRR